MARANTAYYARRDQFADFTTSPEISQVFGEILGLWAAVAWELIGRPDPVLLVEAGPGRGTLMADAVRAIERVQPSFRAALRLHLIETSPRLRTVQADRLPFATWHDAFADLPPGPVLFLANEFLDALPIRQFVRRGAGWAERHVANGRFVEETAAAPHHPEAPQAVQEDVVEVSEAVRGVGTELGLRLASQGGAALLLDYGPERSGIGDSLQALRNGAPVNPLSAVDGDTDLTAHVDFARFLDAARVAGAETYGPIAQGLFLTRLGLVQRSHRLARTQPPRDAAALLSAAQRLAEPHQMGRLFKAVAVCQAGTPVPAGFESETVSS
jgi:NADH dehydrogenase [ubiquinone] 1 alpha subcomplex assembly factor 7